MNFESLIFDIDGTLWDTRVLIAEGWNLQLRRENLDHLCVTAQGLTPLFGKVMEEIADILFPSIPCPQRYDLMRRCMETEDQYMKQDPCQVGYPRVRETLESLSKNHRIFIVSNSQSGYPELCIEKLGLTPFISGHLCYGDTGTPKGATIRTLMTRHGITDCIYIGDTQGDYKATVEAGIPFIWASYGFGNPDGYTEKIGSFEELLKL